VGWTWGEGGEVQKEARFQPTIVISSDSTIKMVSRTSASAASTSREGSNKAVECARAAPLAEGGKDDQYIVSMSKMGKNKAVYEVGIPGASTSGRSSNKATGKAYVGLDHQQVGTTPAVASTSEFSPSKAASGINEFKQSDSATYNGIGASVSYDRKGETVSLDSSSTLRQPPFAARKRKRELEWDLDVMGAVGWGMWEYEALAYKYNQMGWGFVQALYARHVHLWKRWAWRRWGYLRCRYEAPREEVGPARRTNSEHPQHASGQRGRSIGQEGKATESNTKYETPPKGTHASAVLGSARVSPTGEQGINLLTTSQHVSDDTKGVRKALFSQGVVSRPGSGKGKGEGGE
jgi:hypothetical protein